MMPRDEQGWEGWDEYAPFYDWENARTLGRRDVPFWRRVAAEARRAGARARLRHRPHLAARSRAPASASSASIDRRRCSRARAASRRANVSRARPLVRGDIRALPFKRGALRDGARALRRSAVAAPRARSGGHARVRGARARAAAARSASTWCPTCRTGVSTRTGSSCVGRPRGGAHLTLVESVRQDPGAPAHDLRPAVRRAPRRPHDGALLRADVPHAVRPADDAPARTGRIPRGGGAGRLPRPALGRARRRLDHPGGKGVRFSVPSR